MQSYYLKCKRNTEIVDSKSLKTTNCKSKCVMCGIQKSRIMKQPIHTRLLSSLGIKTPLSKVLLLKKKIF